MITGGSFHWSPFHLHLKRTWNMKILNMELFSFDILSRIKRLHYLPNTIVQHCKCKKKLKNRGAVVSTFAGKKCFQNNSSFLPMSETEQKSPKHFFFLKWTVPRYVAISIVFCNIYNKYLLNICYRKVCINKF